MRRVIPKPADLEQASPSVRRYITELEEYIYGLENSVLVRMAQDHLSLDLSAPPHDVPCPVCFAFALEPCRTEPRLPPEEGSVFPRPGKWPDTSLLRAPHDERALHREAHPEFAVRVVKGG